MCREFTTKSLSDRPGHVRRQKLRAHRDRAAGLRPGARSGRTANRAKRRSGRRAPLQGGDRAYGHRESGPPSRGRRGGRAVAERLQGSRGEAREPAAVTTPLPNTYGTRARERR